MGIVANTIPGTYFYMVYIMLVVMVVSTWYYGALAGLLYTIGERFGWGKWVGYLADGTPPNYQSNNGKGFPYIHYIANYFVDEYKDFRKYSQIALTLRGMLWWMPLMVLLGCIGVFPWWLVLVNSIVAGIGFPIACELGKRWQYTLQSKWLCMSPGWENQEVVYGIVQFLVFTLSIVLVVLW